MTDTIMDAVQSTCILAALDFTALGLTRTDRAASRKAESDAGAITGAARVVGNRLAGVDHYHKRIIAVQNAAAATLRGYSMPYGDEKKWRLLPTANFEKLITELARHRADYDAAIKDLIDNADEIIASANQNKGDLDIPVPTKDELVNAYSFGQSFRPVPDGRHFRNLPDAVQHKLTRSIDRQVEQAVLSAQEDTLERFVKPLEHFCEAMTKYDQRLVDQARGVDVGLRGRFNGTVVGNIKEIYDVLASFNVLGDERLTELGNQLASLAATDPQDLRDDDALRSAAKERASKVLSQINSWLAPPMQEAAE